jgi:hypothetical protein
MVVTATGVGGATEDGQYRRQRHHDGSLEDMGHG